MIAGHPHKRAGRHTVPHRITLLCPRALLLLFLAHWGLPVNEIDLDAK